MSFRSTLIAASGASGDPYADIDFVVRVIDASVPWKTYHTYPAGHETTIDWGDGTAEYLKHYHRGIYQRHYYASAGEYRVRIRNSAGITFFSFYNSGDNESSYPCSINSLYLPDITSAYVMFYQLRNAEFWLPSNFHLSNAVTNVSSMFAFAGKIKYYPPASEYWNNPSITQYDYAFRSATWINNNNPDIPENWK